MLSCQQFTESVNSYSLVIRSTVPGQFHQTSSCAAKVIMFLALNALKCRSHSAEDAWHSVDDRTLNGY